ncbi:chromosome partition protein MukE [Vibrio sp. MACH09]|uniref:chromosome partition protein MukE n=1 Tax=Vibrio sp. MACH09 TaxID=3025122 RepID=UPI002791007C|nr:chromosome partition protein MukE [Vibrio sp. MACH09]GLO61206.1 chromosome partition protein MukE [Vibrio sp. MACH09]
MSSTDFDEYMSVKLAKVISNPLFPTLDSALRAGRHISSDDLDNHSLLTDFESELVGFYQRYNTELVKAPEGFFYLRPRNASLIGRSVLTELDMLVGKVLCYLYLSPERLANEGIFSHHDLYEELLSLSDEKKLIKLVTNRATGSDLDREKLFEKVRTSLRRLKKIGMVHSMGEEGKFIISEAVFRFGADARLGDDLQQAQIRLIKDGEAVVEKKVEKQPEQPSDTDEALA